MSSVIEAVGVDESEDSEQFALGIRLYNLCVHSNNKEQFRD
jgi:hypothetical protein